MEQTNLGHQTKYQNFRETLKLINLKEILVNQIGDMDCNEEWERLRYLVSKAPNKLLKQQLILKKILN